MAKKIVILGAPNVGKSSLFNRLLRDKIAITSDIEGTTRDINIKKIALNSYHALLCDTAGLARKANGIFKNVKKLIFDFISEGDLILYVISAECGINDDDLRTFRTFKNAVLIVNKTDIEKNERWEYGAFGAEKVFFVSSLHNRGMKQLKDFLESWVGNLDLHSADSRESRESNKIQSKSQNDSRGSILDEKSGLRSHEQGNKTSSLLTKRVASLHDFSPKDDALFLTLHLMGSHVAYKNRYPKHFEKFSSSDIAHTENPKAKGDLAEYANSILYTDSIIGEVIRRFADKDSIVIYISDHGNDVWDSGSGSLRLDNNITRYMVEVPFVVYVSDIFKVRHSRIYKQIAESTKKPFMLDDLIHALIDIAGFRIEGYESARSIFSKDFNANRARLLGTKASVDYDKKLKSKQHT